jgi:ABC-type glycerol-3-phosphate transport system permease component
VWGRALWGQRWARLPPLDAAAHGRDLSQLRTFGSNIDIIAPATFVSLMIPLAVFFAFQRYFVQGLLAGSVK